MRVQFNLDEMQPAGLALSGQAAADLRGRFRRLGLGVLAGAMDGALEILFREHTRRETGAPEGAAPVLDIPVERLTAREIVSAGRLFRRVADHLAGAGHNPSPLFTVLAAAFARGPALAKAWMN